MSKNDVQIFYGFENISAVKEYEKTKLEKNSSSKLNV